MMSIKNHTEHNGNHHHHHDFMTNITTTVSPTEHVTSISSNSASIVTENVTEIDSAIHHHHFTDVKNTNEQFFSQISDHGITFNSFFNSHRVVLRAKELLHSPHPFIMTTFPKIFHGCYGSASDTHFYQNTAP